MSLIDKEKVIEEINFCIEHTHSVYTDAFVYLKTIIESIPVVNQWISCNEKLPKCRWVHDVFNRSTDYMSEKVLVTVKTKNCDGTHYFVSTDIMTGKNETDVHWLMGSGYGGSAVYDQEVIAWQPLPKSFEEKENVD